MPVPKTPPKMFETRSQAWKEVGLLRQISPQVVKRARLEVLVLLPLFIGVVVLYDNRVSLLGKHVAAVVNSRARLSIRHTWNWKKRSTRP